jgi:hypothetical protein
MPRDGHEEASSCFPQMTMNKKKFLPGTNMTTPGTLKNCVKMAITIHTFLFCTVSHRKRFMVLKQHGFNDFQAMFGISLFTHNSTVILCVPFLTLWQD